jgi:hypothetical protein
MVLFLLAAIPLLGIIYLYKFYGSALEMRDVLRPGTAGILLMAAAMLLMYIFSSYAEFAFTRGGIFLREWIYGFALPYLLVLVGLIVLRRKIVPEVRPHYEPRLYGQLCAFWFGMGSMTALFHVLYAFGSYSAYDLFLYPLLLFLFCCGSAYLTALFFTREEPIRYLYAASGLLLGAVLALVPFFMYINYPLTAYILLTVFLVLGGLFIYLLEGRRLIPKP